MPITYSTDTMPSPEMIIELYRSAQLIRPLQDFNRIAKMYKHSNLIVTAWDQHQLVGIARSLTDFCFFCYVSDLAVRDEYKHKGIGKKLIQITKDIVGEESNLVLLAAASAMEYYPKIGLEKAENGFIIKRMK